MTPEELAAARARAELETRARAALKELIVHVVFMTLVICITYSATDSQSFYVHRIIGDTITDDFTANVGVLAIINQSVRHIQNLKSHIFVVQILVSSIKYSTEYC